MLLLVGKEEERLGKGRLAREDPRRAGIRK
jgi:hypothetical protein